MSTTIRLHLGNELRGRLQHFTMSKFTQKATNFKWGRKPHKHEANICKNLRNGKELKSQTWNKYTLAKSLMKPLTMKFVKIQALFQNCWTLRAMKLRDTRCTILRVLTSNFKEFKLAIKLHFIKQNIHKYCYSATLCHPLRSLVCYSLALVYSRCSGPSAWSSFKNVFNSAIHTKA